MKTIKHTLIILTLILNVVSCKKYPDGPSFSLLTKKKRLCNEWKVSEWKINDVSQNLSGSSIELTIKKDDSYVSSYTIGALTLSENGKWEFASNKEKITFRPSTQNAKAIEYDILELKKSEIRLKYIDDFKNTNVLTYQQK